MTMNKAMRKSVIGSLSMTPAKLAEETTWIAEATASVDARIHAAGVALIIASMPKAEFGGNYNIAGALDFIKAISAGQSRNRIVAWVHKFSNIRLSAAKQDDGTFKFSAKLLKLTDGDYGVADPIAADASPFWKAFNEGDAVDVAFTTMSLQQSLASILRRVAKAKDANKLDLTPADLAIVASLTRLQAETKARAEHRKVEAVSPAVTETVDALAEA